MLKSDQFISKLSETNILAQYASYVQNSLVKLNEQNSADSEPEDILLSYDEFREFIIIEWLGKKSFADNLAFEYQFNLLKA